MKIFASSRSFGLHCQEAVEMIKEVAEVERSTFNRALTEAELIKILPAYDGIIVGVDKISKEVVQECNKLKIVAKHGAGVDNIDLNACTKRGVVVTYVPGASAESVADFTFCLILALARKLIDAHISTKSGKWESKKFMGVELYNKSIGIIGMGGIGSRVARRARGFGMRILCFTNNPERHNEEGRKYRIKFVDLPTLLEESDIITIHCALTPATKGLIGSEEFSLMKKSALLVNTARGPIVDENALYKALKEKKIAGAALDVYSEEPPKPSYKKIFELANVIVSPHIASYTIDAIMNVDLIQARDIVRVLRGEKPEFVANPEVLKAFIKR
ncbi:MAG: phosphoglycerate dehydrogenase [Promethearchaeota archaeon]